MNNFIVLDIETEAEKSWDSVANPRNSFILAYCVKDDSIEYTTYINNETDLETLIDLITEKEILVAHNAKFELGFLWKYEKIKDWIKQGGKIFCTQLAEYYITNHTAQWAGLRDLAVNKYNCPERTKWIDDLFFKNKKSEYNKLSEIPEKYILEDVTNDVKDTYIIYKKQLLDIQKRAANFKRLIEIEMDFLITTTIMENNGMSIDKDTATKNKEMCENELNNIETKLDFIIKKYWVVEHVDKAINR